MLPAWLYTNRTPTLSAERHATSHDRVIISGLMIKMNLSGIPIGLSTSSNAPVPERLRIVQSMTPRSNEIEPPLKVRCLRFPRLSSITRVIERPVSSAGPRNVKFSAPLNKSRRAPLGILSIRLLVDWCQQQRSKHPNFVETIRIRNLQVSGSAIRAASHDVQG